jgi:hypothetical protein
MAYNDTPQANQRISDTQPLIRSNFQQIQTALSVNHIPIADVSGNQGKHKFVTFVAQNPDPVFVGTDEGMYSVATIAGPNPTINGPELFLKKFYDSGTLNFDVPFTASVISNTPVGSITNAMTQGWSYLPSGILLKWGLGTASNVAVPTNSIPFPAGPGIPAFANCFTVVATPVSAATTFAVTQVSALNFLTTPLPNNFQLMYFAIGWGT